MSASVRTDCARAAGAETDKPAAPKANIRETAKICNFFIATTSKAARNVATFFWIDVGFISASLVKTHLPGKSYGRDGAAAQIHAGEGENLPSPFPCAIYPFSFW